VERFQLLNNNTIVASFTHERTLLGDTYGDIVVHVPEQLPIRLKKTCTDRAFDNWISRRSIPVNRHHMEAMLGALNLEKPFDLMRYSHALSLNDTFWIKEESEDVTFSAINLYDNKFDEALGWIAFTGLPSDISRNLSTPELTTVGMLPKYWQRIGMEDIILCKGGTSGYSNAGYEPYHEVAAHIIAKYLGVQTIPYHLEKRNDKIVSISKLFTTKQTGLITGSEYIDYKSDIAGYRSLRDFLTYMKEDEIDSQGFYEMCFLDYIIENFDRHLNNWGFNVDNQTQRITGFAPIWDNGMSLDYDKPQEMRDKFDFASFNIKYDFLKDCPYTRDFQSRVNKLLVRIKSNELLGEIYTATKAYYPEMNLHKRTVEFVAERGMDFLRPLEMKMAQTTQRSEMPSIIAEIEKGRQQKRETNQQKMKKPQNKKPGHEI